MIDKKVALNILHELEIRHKKHEYEKTSADGVYRICQAVVAKKAGFTNRNEWETILSELKVRELFLKKEYYEIVHCREIFKDTKTGNLYCRVDDKNSRYWFTFNGSEPDCPLSTGDKLNIEGEGIFCIIRDDLTDYAKALFISKYEII